jgi:hypothetical protein
MKCEGRSGRPELRRVPEPPLGAGARYAWARLLMMSTAALPSRPIPRCWPSCWTISEILGQSAIHITLNLYTHVSEGMQRHTLEALKELIGGQLGRQEAEWTDDQDVAHDG